MIVWEDDRNSVTQGFNLYGSLVNLIRLSGYVYDGNIGDESTPLSNVKVELYCSNDNDDLGSLLKSTTTDSEGWYGFIISDTCNYYNIVKTDPINYSSTGATSQDGTVINNNWIQYEYPLEDKILTGNKFWSYVETDSVMIDLVISDVGYEDDLIWYKITNIGSDTITDGHYTALFVDDVFIVSDYIDTALIFGEQLTRYFEYNWTCTPPDDNIEVIADYEGNITELDETNNKIDEDWSCINQDGDIDGPGSWNDNDSNQFTIKPNDFKTINFTSEGNRLNLSISFITKGLFNLYIIESESINSTVTLNYTTAKFEKSRITDEYNLEIDVIDDTEYQIILENIGKDDITIKIEYETKNREGSFGDIGGPWLLGIITVIIVGIVIVYSIKNEYRIRELVSKEKSKIDRIYGKKMIELYKKNPDKVLEIYKEMKEMSNKEGYELSKSISERADNALKQLKRK